MQMNAHWLPLGTMGSFDSLPKDENRSDSREPGELRHLNGGSGDAHPHRDRKLGKSRKAI